MITNPQRTDAPDILKGLIAGVAGGLLASLVAQFQALWSKAAESGCPPTKRSCRRFDYPNRQRKFRFPSMPMRWSRNWFTDL
jgi:hypothetical protein